MGDDLTHQLAIFVERAEASLAGMMFGLAARGGKPKRHIGVFGVSENKVAAGGIGKDSGKLLV